MGRPLTTRSSGRSNSHAMFGDIAPPLNASVRLPTVVPHLEASARMNSAFEVPLRFSGRRVAVVRAKPSGIQAIKALLQTSLASAACGNARCLRRGHPSPVVSSCSSVRLGGVCRWRRGLTARSMHLNRLASVETNPSATPGLYGSVPSAYGGHIMRQPNYSFERTVKPPRNVRPHRAAAQRER